MRERTELPEEKDGALLRSAALGRETCLHIASARLVGKRVMVVDQPHQPFLKHMGVDLRRRNVGVAEQLLHRAEIRAVLQEMAGKGVADHMRRYFRGGDAGAGGERLELTREHLARQMPALPSGGEQIWARGQSRRSVAK